MAQNGEFSIIAQYFTHNTFGAWKSKGVGDDCAIIDMPAGRIAVTADMMAVGTHFLLDTRPEDIGYKALAVNLSDLAAAGAQPRAFFLSIALPDRDDAWLAGFTAGLMELARETQCPLLGGDTTRTASVGDVRAPATFSITAMGDLPPQMGLTRAGAHPGDDIWVSGCVGGAYAALKHRWGEWTLPAELYPAAAQRMDRPQARLALGRALLSSASACADVSDGLAQDLGHILERSGVAADILWDAVPLHPAVKALSADRRIEAAMNGGDDYELVFTAPHEKKGLIEQASISALTPVTCIGRIREADDATERLLMHDDKGNTVLLPAGGYDHFA
ncbi:thiamine-phosphate kinase [uncultured Duodenibacillus sp.]|uniref:thiamine-phosphate kinase n=1 Tax=uncultured Duodenibacillus sp. TaxID=1980699 RepID=UPI00258B867F|nr:thiamine-phosphate kinase [uncultured Duodenibacillus sp.]